MSSRPTRQARTITAEAAAALVQSGDWVEYGTSVAQPDVFDAALAARVDELQGVNIRGAFAVAPRAVVEADPTGEHFRLFSWHFSAWERRMHDAGLCHYVPMNLGETADYYRRFIEPPAIVVLKTRPMDEHGWFNFGPTNIWHHAILERARLVVLETSTAVPEVNGEDNRIHCSQVDYVIEGNNAPLFELPAAPPSEIDRAVGSYIAAEVDDGACLQIGIGGMPNAVCAQLRDSGHRDLGVHTEMLTDGLVELYQSGQVTGARKQLRPGKLVFSFGVGTRNMYDTLDGNEDFLCCPSDFTNMPHVIMRNDNFVSINNTTQMDLQGQAASESDGYRHISGSGGQLQFVRGAYASNNGKSFMCLASTYEKNGIRKSRITAELTPGNIVTTPRTDTMYVVTEYGIVNLKGKSVPERAKALISIAHPDFREQLEREAHERRLLPRGFR